MEETAVFARSIAVHILIVCTNFTVKESVLQKYRELEPGACLFS